MSEVTLSPRIQPSVPLEAPCIRPDAFASLSEREIGELTVWHGNEEAHLGDFFDVCGGPSDQVRIVGDASRVKHLGAGMAAGRLVVEGSADMHAGAGMTGGHLCIEGNADDWAGAEMAGGMLEIRGDAGRHLGDAYAGSRRGMTGGVLLVHGTAGAQSAGRMRRGVIAVAGNVGEYAGAFMLAGSLIVLGALGRRPGAGMRRGSIVAGSVPELLPTFGFACVYRPSFLDVYLRRLACYGLPVDNRFLEGEYQRYNGDFTDLGRGEILVLSGASS